MLAFFPFYIKLPLNWCLLSFNDIIMVMWPLGGICSKGLIVSLCSKLIVNTGFAGEKYYF